MTVTATPKDDTFGLKSLTLDLMGTGSATALRAATASRWARPTHWWWPPSASTGNGGSGSGTGGNGGDGDGTGTDTGDGAGDEDDEGLQDGLNMDVEYNIKGLVLAAYAEWGANGGGKTFAQWLKASPACCVRLSPTAWTTWPQRLSPRIPTRPRAWQRCCWPAERTQWPEQQERRHHRQGAPALHGYRQRGDLSTWLTTGSGMASGTVEENPCTVHRQPAELDGASVCQLGEQRHVP